MSTRQNHLTTECELTMSLSFDTIANTRGVVYSCTEGSKWAHLMGTLFDNLAVSVKPKFVYNKMGNTEGTPIFRRHRRD